jgi:HD-GYP domain-containing protein (c-di-GMP phosphodiesterase class II)
VVHPEQPDQDLLKPGYVLEDKVLLRLRGLGIDHLYVDYPGLDDLDRHLAANLSPARQKLYNQIKETIVAGQKRTRPAVSYTDYYATTREMVLTLMSQGEHPVYLEHMSRMGDDAVIHATAVAHLGLLLGIKLELYLIEQRSRLPAKHAREVVNIGVGGMLHDMGKLALPQELQQYNCLNPPTDPQQLNEWETHAQRGYDMIRGGVEPSAAIAVLNHHQRWDGLGFPALSVKDQPPQRPAEQHIHVFARIIAVADLYDRLASPCDGSPRRSNVEVLHLMRTTYGSWCDPTVLKALQAVAPPFPPGVTVTLSDGGCAVVVQVPPDDPYRPIVRRIVGADLELDSRRLDLRREESIRITHVGRTPVEQFIPAAPQPERAQSARAAAVAA